MLDAGAKPRLLVLTSTYPRWQRDHEPPFVHELARRLTDSFDVSVLAPHAPGALRHETMDGVEVHRFRYAPDRFEKLAYDGGIPSRLRQHPWLATLVPSFVLANLIAAYHLIRQLRPVALHAHWLIPGGLIGAVLKELAPGHRALLITAHGADVHLTGRWPAGWMKRLAVESADVVTVVSDALRQQVLPFAPAETSVEIAPMGVDLQTQFTPAEHPAGTPSLVFAGRLVEKKGVAVLLEAMPKVLARQPDATLLLVGQGPLERDLKEKAERMRLGDAVKFLGAVRNQALPEVLRQARLAVLPFRRADDGDAEGFGLVAVEAMGCGLPVIVGDVPAIHDVVQHGLTGWVVPTDSPDALAEAIVHLLQDPAVSARLGSDARRYAISHFDWSVASRRYREILLRLSR